MKIVRNGNSSIIKLLHLNQNHDSFYRFNTCVLFEDCSEGLLLCNSISGELVLLSHQEVHEISNMPGKVPESLSPLVDKGYLVPYDYDENKIIGQLRNIIRKSWGEYYRSYVILPTTYCNARCFYCYESNVVHRNMTNQTINKLVSFIDDHYDGKKVYLSWFGGEPLLRADIISKICSELSNRNIKYDSRMVSNGFLFNTDLIEVAIQSWNLSLVQITLDGTEKIYNNTKSYIGIRENAYNRVLNNINELLSKGIRINIRLNLDKHNKENLLELIDELNHKMRNKCYLSVYVSVLNEGAGFMPIDHEEGEVDELWDYAKHLELKLSDMDLNRKGRKLPQLRINHCMADGNNTILCSPDGYLGKCEHYPDRFFVGSLDSGINDNTMIEWWKERKIITDCQQCQLMAECIKLENCPVNRNIICTEKDRNKRVTAFKQAMLNIYTDSISKV